jgi:hypothetical protein
MTRKDRKRPYHFRKCLRLSAWETRIRESAKSRRSRRPNRSPHPDVCVKISPKPPRGSPAKLRIRSRASHTADKNLILPRIGRRPYTNCRISKHKNQTEILPRFAASLRHFRLVPHLALQPPVAIGSSPQNQQHPAPAVERRFSSRHLNNLMFIAPFRSQIS